MCYTMFTVKKGENEMGKTFIYMVNTEVVAADSRPWGYAWWMAKEKAITDHAKIFRDVVSNSGVRNEVYCTGGVFLPIHLITEKDMKIF